MISRKSLFATSLLLAHLLGDLSIFNDQHTSFILVSSFYFVLICHYPVLDGLIDIIKPLQSAVLLFNHMPHDNFPENKLKMPEITIGAVNWKSPGPNSAQAQGLSLKPDQDRIDLVTPDI